MTERYNAGKKKMLIVIILIFLMIVSINFLPKLLRTKVNTILPIEKNYTEKIKANALVLLPEIVYKNDSNSEVMRVAVEGQRVPVGAEVANILYGRDMTNQKDELSDVERRIKLLEDGLDSVLADSVTSFQISVSNNEYSNLRGLKEDINIRLSINEFSVFNEDSSNIESIAELKNRRDRLKALLDSNLTRVYSHQSGIVSYETDGYEELLDINNLEDITPDKFTSTYKPKKNSEAIFKIIDGFDWILSVLSDDLSLEVGTSYELVLTDDEENTYLLKAPLIMANETDANAIYFFKSNLLMDKIYSHRRFEIEIVKESRNALRIPIEALIEIDGEPGVLVKEYYGVIRFRPVIIIGTEENFCYVEHGDSYGYIETNEGKRRKTINIYTEVVTAPGKHTEGEILQ